MSAITDKRVHPRTGAIAWRTMDTEVKTISEFTAYPGLYGIKLKDRIKQGSITITENVTGGTEFSIVTTAPLAGQCYIDYETAVIEFHSDDAGTEVAVDYQGGGSVASKQNLETLVSVPSFVSVDNLSEKTTLDGTELLQVSESSGTKKATTDTQADYTINSILGKPSEAPANDDKIPFADTSDSDNPKTTTLGEIARGWVQLGYTITFVSDDSATGYQSYSVKVTGTDVTGILKKGMRIKLTDSGDQFFIISTNPVYSTDTTFKLYGGNDSTGPGVLSGGAITNVYYSTSHSPYAPDGTWDSVNWDITVTDTTNRTVSTPTINAVYDPSSGSMSPSATVEMNVPVGEWDLIGKIYGFCDIGSAQNNTLTFGMSDSKTSFSDNELIAKQVGYQFIGTSKYVGKKNVSLASAKTYYPVISIDGSGITSIIFSSADSTLVLLARCRLL